MNYVIGSGPAGVSSAKALLALRLPVTMLDAGLTLDEDNQNKITHLTKLPKEEWMGPAATFLREDMQGKSSGIPQKLIFGSDYPYRTPSGGTPVDFQMACASASYALGGLSTVWGSAVMPYHLRDMAGWPVSSEELTEHYRAVQGWMPVSAHFDDLNVEYPVFAENPHRMAMSRQAAQMLMKMEKHRHRLRRSGVTFGKSRIAVEAQKHETTRCVRCGLCMYGCPYKLIYSSEATVEEMKADPLFRYVGGVVVHSVKESEDSVDIHGVDESGGHLSFNGERAYLGAGLTLVQISF